MTDAAAVFIHGLFSSSKAWAPFHGLLSQDSEITNTYDIKSFDYSSPRVQIKPTRRIPDFNILADRLANLLEFQLNDYERLVLVTHSQGGLIALRYLSRRLAEGDGRALTKIRRIIMFACPNNGSELLLSLRRTFLRNHNQERELRPLADSVIETQRRVLADIIYAPAASDHSCPIPIVAYAGDLDNVVTPASAKSVFPLTGVVPGDHSSLIAPTDREDISYATLRSELRRALIEPFPAWRPSGTVDVPTEKPMEVHVEFITRGPVMIQFGRDGRTQVFVHSGPIDQISDVDIVATSENTYMQMAMTFKPSVSGRIRRASAKKGPTGEILDDIVCDELNEWLRQNGRFGLPVEPGTVAPTSSGTLEKRNVHRIYHAAIGSPVHGTDKFTVNPLTVAQAVHNTFDVARRERLELDLPLRSICFPLFGAGLGGLNAEVCFEWMWRAVDQELQHDDTWEIHFCTWSVPETEIVLAAVQRHAT